MSPPPRDVFFNDRLNRHGGSLYGRGARAVPTSTRKRSAPTFAGPSPTIDTAPMRQQTSLDGPQSSTFATQPSAKSSSPAVTDEQVVSSNIYLSLSIRYIGHCFETFRQRTWQAAYQRMILLSWAMGSDVWMYRCRPQPIWLISMLNQHAIPRNGNIAFRWPQSTIAWFRMINGYYLIHLVNFI